MQKRGSITHEIYFIMFQVFLVIAVAFFLFSYANIVIKDSTYEKQIVSKDVSLALNAIQGISGSAFYLYTSPVEIEKYKFWFHQQHTNIIEKETQYISYPFFKDKNLKDDFGQDERDLLMYPSNIGISKSGQDISIKWNRLTHQHYQSCPSINTKYENPKILLDMGNNEIDWLIADAITAPQNMEIEKIRSSSEELTLEERKLKIQESTTNMIISINTIPQQSTQEISRVYYNSQTLNKLSHSKLACFISNNIQKELEQINSITTPIEPSTFYLDESKTILSLPNNIIYLELENQNLQQNNDFIKISTAIKNAIQDYYS